MMHILVMIGDQELSRWPVPDEALVDQEGASWQSNAAARDSFIEVYIQYVRLMTFRITSKFEGQFNKLTYQIAVESKMNREEVIKL